jgi:hypothetical protein
VPEADWCSSSELDLQGVRLEGYGRARKSVIKEMIMKTFRSYTPRVLVAAAVTSIFATPAFAAPTHHGGRSKEARCAAQFERAQRTDIESFQRYDAETFRAIHHPDAVTIFASGDAFYGVDEIMNALSRHFRDREALSTWTEVYRIVDGCNSAFILYDSTYTIPSIGYHQRTLTGVTYTYQHNRWLGIADQGTYIEPPSQ